MNNIEKLHSISLKRERIILGLMSGTSLDGLDLALCKFSGNGLTTKTEVLKFTTVPFSTDFKEEIKQVFSKQLVDLELLCLLNEKIGLVHANIINQTLAGWAISNDEVDLIASHGQTIYHAPKIKHRKQAYPNGTMQIGDGDHIAVQTGIITLSDFRQKHIAAGGEGAPLAVYGDYFLFSDPEKDRIMLNIGGIANFTWLPARGSAEEIFSTDTGPGNTLIDQFMQANFNLYFDEDAKHAKKGKVNSGLLDALLKNSFFEEAVPKSTGPELFNLIYLQEALATVNDAGLSPYDILATLCEFTASAIAKEVLSAINFREKSNLEVIISGGGMHNPLIIERLKFYLPSVVVKDTSVLGIMPDAKEAVLFALLANETISGQVAVIPAGNESPMVCMGKISLPF